MAVVWNFENAAHLLRRAAFGGTPQEIQDFLDAHDSLADAVDDLLSFGVSTKKPGKGGKDPYRAEIKQKQWWLKTMLKAKKPSDALREKMVLFWHNHLCSGWNKVIEGSYNTSYMPIQNGLFRRYASGNFRELVRDFNRDPANLYYLDGIQNYASDWDGHVAANENFSRELLELFTLGVTQLADDGSPDPSKPNYTESDVHQLARVLTGWVQIEKGVGVWQGWAWDGGTLDDNGDDIADDITVFGETRNTFKIGLEVAGTDDDILKKILGRLDDAGNHQAAMYICRKLWTWFAYPPPAPGMKALIAGFAATLVASDYEVKPVLTEMFNHDEFFSDRAKSRTVKNPVDYMVGTFKALGLKSAGKTIGESGRLMIDMLEEMGMELFEPPNVAGWPGGTRWITTGTLVNRLDFARRVAEAASGTSALHLETVVTMGSASADPAVVVDEILARFGLDGSQGGVSLTTAQVDALVYFITAEGTKLTLNLTNEDTSDARNLVRGAIALALQTGEAQIF